MISAEFGVETIFGNPAAIAFGATAFLPTPGFFIPLCLLPACIAAIHLLPVRLLLCRLPGGGLAFVTRLHLPLPRLLGGPGGLGFLA